MQAEEVASWRAPERTFPGELRLRFEAVVFDWDGTAVVDRHADASPIRRTIEALSLRGLDFAIVSGTHVANIDGQLRARPAGPGRLHLLLNRGSEVFAVDELGVKLIDRRTASPEEDRALTTAAELTRQKLAGRGLRTALVSDRLNRRKIDLIPEPEWADPPKAKLGELLSAVDARLARAGFAPPYLSEVAALAKDAASEAGLPYARVTSDAKHVEIGLTDKSDSAEWVFRDLWERGVGAQSVIVAGDEMGPLGGLPGSDWLMRVPRSEGATFVSVGVEPNGVPRGVLALGGGPQAFHDLLGDQLKRRDGGELPLVAQDLSWIVVVEEHDADLERVREAELTIADGQIGTSGSCVFPLSGETPRVLASGVYTGEGPESELVHCPRWNRLEGRAPPLTLRRVLELRTGLLRQELGHTTGPVEAILFSSFARPGVVVLRARGALASRPSDLLEVRILAPPLPEARVQSETQDGAQWMRVTADPGGVVAGATQVLRGSSAVCLDRFGVYEANPRSESSPGSAQRHLRASQEAGFERLLNEHRAAWAKRWESADVIVDGDSELQLAVRFALFHLMASVADSGEAAVGARGLTGPAYRGHVFWDSDVFVLPFLAATHPKAARAMLEYRIARLPAARAAARALGRNGARFPWESAESGEDVTPAFARVRTGETIPVITGRSEEHVVADVAWAAACYVDWTGDDAFATGPGRALFVETARYWASRIRVDLAGRSHIDDVMGPDEYHERVNDNAFTNVMARWNLKQAARSAFDSDAGVSDDERQDWLAKASSLVDGYDRETGIYEQFAGYGELEPLIIDQVAPRPVDAYVLLGVDRVGATQVIKQADVLMLHHMIPREVVAGSLAPNLAFYEPRTAHGSSLSPGIHAGLFARAGQLKDAVDALRIASRIDLDDLTGTTAGGVHLAAMGSVWQALAFGFVGLRPNGDVLEINPRLPRWNALEVRVRFRGNPVQIRVERGSISIRTERPLLVRLGDADHLGTSRPLERVIPPERRFERLGDETKANGS